MIKHIKEVLDDVVEKLCFLNESKKIYFQRAEINESMLRNREATQNELFGDPSRFSINQNHNISYAERSN
jgi:hypothetical protein